MYLSQFMSSGAHIMLIGPICSWEMPQCSVSALAGFLNSAMIIPVTKCLSTDAKIKRFFSGIWPISGFYA